MKTQGESHPTPLVITDCKAVRDLQPTVPSCRPVFLIQQNLLKVGISFQVEATRLQTWRDVSSLLKNVLCSLEGVYKYPKPGTRVGFALLKVYMYIFI